MLGRLCFVIVALGALAAAPAAAGDGPLFVSQGGTGLLAPAGAWPGGPVRIVPVSVSSANDTELEVISAKDGSVLNTTDLVGQWGLPFTPAGAEGISRDGRTVILADTQSGLVSPSNFLVVDPRTMRIRQPITLEGVFSYDALSPDGSTLYLIQYKGARAGDLTHYVVRAYDLRTDRLLPGRIADRTQKGWVMHGSPVTRTSSADGRWVYTLYLNPGGYPFVHALDTVRGVAHCVGVPLANQSGIYNLVLALHGRTLSVHWRSGRPFLNVDTATWRVSSAHAGFDLWWLALAALPLAAAGAAALAVRRQRRAKELEQGLTELLRSAERQILV
jgi:hypothetical protein